MSAQAEAVLRDARFEASLRDLAARLDLPYDDVRAEALDGLTQLAARHDAIPMAAWRRFGAWLLRGYELHVDDEALARLRRLDQQHTLVWLPSHRSYLDTWALPMALDRAGFPPYFVVGGANLDFWPFGDIARRTGLVFVRRDTKDDPVYRVVLRQYLAHLVRTGADFGWSIEGGRTRTGKLRPPRFGLLRYLSDAVASEDCADVLLVPVSIVWDGLQEVPMMVAESAGRLKRSEDLRWLIEYGRRQRAAQGRVYIDFGEPLPLRGKLAELAAEPEGRGHEVERVALEVSHRLNCVTPVTTAAISTLALLAADRALTVDELVEQARPMVAYLECRGAPLAGPGRPDDRAHIESTLRELADAGAVTCVAGRTTVWAIGPDQHLVAAFYRNTAAHFLVNRAIAELVVARVGDIESPEALEQGSREALRLRDVLKFEFFFARRRIFVEEIREEVALLRERAETIVAPLILRPSLEAYEVVGDELAGSADDALDEEAFLSKCLALGRQWQVQRRIASSESVSLELFRTGLRLAKARGVWEGGGDLAARRAAFAHEMTDTANQVRSLLTLERHAALQVQVT